MDIDYVIVWYDVDKKFLGLKQAYNFLDKPKACPFMVIFPQNPSWSGYLCTTNFLLMKTCP